VTDKKIRYSFGKKKKKKKERNENSFSCLYFEYSSITTNTVNARILMRDVTPPRHETCRRIMTRERSALSPSSDRLVI